jgi:probable addiction module antidote protein
MTVTIAKWDTAEVLNTRERVVAYLDAVLADGDPEMLKLALGNIARSKGMTEIAKQTGIRRTSLYRALSPEGNPEFATVAGVIRALGLRLSVTPDATHRAAARRPALIRAPAMGAKPPPKQRQRKRR